MRRLPQYISNLKHGVWQQSGLKSSNDPPNHGVGDLLAGKTLGIWGFGKIGRLVAGYGTAFGMDVLVWGRDASLAAARERLYAVATDRRDFFARSDVVTLHLRLNDETRGIVTLEDLQAMKPTALLVNTSRAELIATGRADPGAEQPRPGWPRSTCSRASRRSPASRCCGWRTWSARRTSASSRRRATKRCSARRSGTSSATSRARRPTWSTRRC